MNMKNIIKGIITSLIGLVTMVMTLFLVFAGTMDFVWGGIAGLSIGCVLLLSPDTLVKKFGDLLSKMTGKATDSTITDPAEKEFKEKE
jgi:hypothetical protein